MTKTETYLGSRIEIWEGMTGFAARIKKAANRRVETTMVWSGASELEATNKAKEWIARNRMADNAMRAL